MAGSALTDYLAAKDRDRFAALMRRYSHDVISTASNLVIAAEVSSKLINARTSQMLAEPSTVQMASHPFEIMRHYGLGFPRVVRRFVWGDQPDNPRTVAAHLREHWSPFDAPMWDQFVKEYVKFVTAQFQPIEDLSKEIAEWAQSGALTPPEQSAALRDTLEQLTDTVQRVWVLLDPQVAEEHVLPVIQSAAKAD
jgi:hypothetical protein